MLLALKQGALRELSHHALPGADPLTLLAVRRSQGRACPSESLMMGVFSLQLGY